MAKQNLDLSAFSLDTGTKILQKDQEAKAGRPSSKEKGVKYVDLHVQIPATTKQKIMQALSGKFFGVYKTQAELVNVALLEMLESDEQEGEAVE